jgi:hypothetical protein
LSDRPQNTLIRILVRWLSFPLTSPFDDGIVVERRSAMAATRRIGQLPLWASETLAASRLRDAILEEEWLQRRVDQDEELRRTRPDIWRSLDAKRRAANRAAAATNRRLRALGLQPIATEPSLGQRRQKLQRLKRQNVAAIAAFRRTVPEIDGKSRGMPLARRRSGRGDD